MSAASTHEFRSAVFLLRFAFGSLAHPGRLMNAVISPEKVERNGAFINVAGPVYEREQRAQMCRLPLELASGDLCDVTDGQSDKYVACRVGVTAAVMFLSKTHSFIVAVKALTVCPRSICRVSRARIFERLNSHPSLAATR